MKLSEKIRLSRCENLVNRVHSLYLDHGLCPKCGSERVKETGFCESDGAFSYKCEACRHSGYGLCCDEKTPTDDEIRAYETFIESQNQSNASFVTADPARTPTTRRLASNLVQRLLLSKE